MVKAIAAMALIALAGNASAQHITLQPGETLLEVSASGSAKAVPDVAEISTGVTSDAATAKTALAANAAVAARLIDAVNAARVPLANVRTEGLSVKPRYRPDKDGDDTDEIVGYRSSNRLKLRLTDISGAPRLIDALFKAGATDLDGPIFSFADDSVPKANARLAAIRNAEAEARDYAGALNMKIGRVIRVSERSAATDGGSDIIVTAFRLSAPPIQPGQQETTVTVWIDYALTK